jgi:hypothetical protein
MVSKKTTTLGATSNKQKKAKKSAAPPRKDATTAPAPVELPLVDQTPAEPPRESAAVQAPTPELVQAKPKRIRESKKAKGDAKQQKLSALDAAAKVLAETGRAMNCQELIAAMAEKGYWTSPGGQTPASTLYAGMLRERKIKGANARFVKVGRGQFALQGAG